MGRIHKEQRLLTIRRRVAFFSVGLIGSAAAIIPVSKILYAGLSESGFVEFFSLLFSDTGVVAAYWQSFAMSLLETIPVTGLIIFSITLLVFLESSKLLVKNLYEYEYQ